MKLPAYRVGLFVAYPAFVAYSFAAGVPVGQAMAKNFFSFAGTMLLILPPAFLLIGIFEVWVDRERVERAFGKTSGIRGYVWALLLAGTTVGGAYVAFPVAYALRKKGAAFNTLLTYVGASAVLRIPMTIFEASFLGLKFTAVRFAVSLPALIGVSAILGRYLDRNGYELPERAELEDASA